MFGFFEDFICHTSANTISNENNGGNIFGLFDDKNNSTIIKRTPYKREQEKKFYCGGIITVNKCKGYTFWINCNDIIFIAVF
jgi:hypothetical protein